MSQTIIKTFIGKNLNIEMNYLIVAFLSHKFAILHSQYKR